MFFFPLKISLLEILIAFGKTLTEGNFSTSGPPPLFPLKISLPEMLIAFGDSRTFTEGNFSTSGPPFLKISLLEMLIAFGNLAFYEILLITSGVRLSVAAGDSSVTTYTQCFV